MCRNERPLWHFIGKKSDKRVVTCIECREGSSQRRRQRLLPYPPKRIAMELTSNTQHRLIAPAPPQLIGAMYGRHVVGIPGPFAFVTGPSTPGYGHGSPTGPSITDAGAFMARDGETFQASQGSRQISQAPRQGGDPPHDDDNNDNSSSSDTNPCRPDLPHSQQRPYFFCQRCGIARGILQDSISSFKHRICVYCHNGNTNENLVTEKKWCFLGHHEVSRQGFSTYLVNENKYEEMQSCRACLLNVSSTGVI
ncbi:hypothetical protein F4776DRAFT_563620 [Hypoxylon sp. NC0597]|nr:hypothetical protein F4776DRAFT_563620 [Hypoxylon sp. NC0597]